MLSFSQRQQPTRPGYRGAPTDGREYEQGKRFHVLAKPKCKNDRACLFQECSKLCSDWARGGNDGGRLSPVTQNQIYFNCTGTCWEPDAGP